MIESARGRVLQFGETKEQGLRRPKQSVSGDLFALVGLDPEDEEDRIAVHNFGLAVDHAAGVVENIRRGDRVTPLSVRRGELEDRRTRLTTELFDVAEGRGIAPEKHRTFDRMVYHWPTEEGGSRARWRFLPGLVGARHVEDSDVSSVLAGTSEDEWRILTEAERERIGALRDAVVDVLSLWNGLSDFERSGLRDSGFPSFGKWTNTDHAGSRGLAPEIPCGDPWERERHVELNVHRLKSAAEWLLAGPSYQGGSAYKQDVRYVQITAHELTWNALGWSVRDNPSWLMDEERDGLDDPLEAAVFDANVLRGHRQDLRRARVRFGREVRRRRVKMAVRLGQLLGAEVKSSSSERAMRTLQIFAPW